MLPPAAVLYAFPMTKSGVYPGKLRIICWLSEVVVRRLPTAATAASVRAKIVMREEFDKSPRLPDVERNFSNDDPFVLRRVVERSSGRVKKL